MNRSIVAFLLCCTVCRGATAKSISASEFLHPRSTSPLLYDLDTAVMNSALSQGHIQIADFPGSETETVTLDLRSAHSPIDGSTQFWEGTSKGDVKIVPPTFLAYRGNVEGEPDSRVFFTAFGNQIMVSITREDGNVYVLGPNKNDTVTGGLLFMKENDLFAYSEFHPFNCITEEIPQPAEPLPVKELLAKYRSEKRGALDEQSHAQLLQVDIAVEADSCFYHAAGNSMNTVLGYIASLFAMSSTIYEDEVNITWHLTWVKVWPSGDPYNVKGNAYGLEDTVPKYWLAHYSNVPRDLAHVLTSIGYGGGGYGYLRMCDTNWSYSMSSPQTGHSYPTFAFTYDAYIVAHEVGHNFGLVHSHSCYWDPPIDTCWTSDDTVYGLKIADACESYPITPRASSGTIMSYCANTNYALHHDSIAYFKLSMTFSKKVDSVLRVDAESESCIMPPSSPTLILISPRGSEKFPGDSTIDLQWSYANITTVSLEFSPDGGSSWSPIAHSVSASDGEYEWRMPNIASQNMLVRVVDDSNSSVADTSLLFFTIVSSSVAAMETTPERFEAVPNPASDYLILLGGSPDEKISYSIENETGATEVKAESVIAGTYGAKIDIAHLPTGIHYLHISSPVSSGISFVHTQ